MSQIAETTLQQLGGRKFIMMVGAKDIYSVNKGEGLTFKFMRGAKNKATHCTVNLDPSDTYTVEFSKVVCKKDPTLGIRTPEKKTVSNFEGIYWDQLTELFRNETGLATS